MKLIDSYISEKLKLDKNLKFKSEEFKLFGIGEYVKFVDFETILNDNDINLPADFKKEIYKYFKNSDEVYKMHGVGPGFGSPEVMDELNMNEIFQSFTKCTECEVREYMSDYFFNISEILWYENYNIRLFRFFVNKDGHKKQKNYMYIKFT